MVKIKQILLVLLDRTQCSYVTCIVLAICGGGGGGGGGGGRGPIIQQKCSVWSGIFFSPEWGCKQKFPTKYKLETPTHCLH